MSRRHLNPLDYVFCVVPQIPIEPFMFEGLENTRHKFAPPPNVPLLLDMVRWYSMGMALGHDCEYFLIVDDDHHYKGPQGDKVSSGIYYQQCLDYLDSNTDVGFMMCKSYFGGAAWGDVPRKNPDNGLISLGWGMIMRNVPEFKFTDEELNFKGSMVESLLCYKMMELGHRVAKRFYCPTLKDPGKTVESGGISYSNETLNANIVGYIRRRYNDPTWEHESKKYPGNLLARQREAIRART